MGFRETVRDYWLAGGGSLLSLVMYLGQQAMGAQPWWPQLPWVYIFLAFLLVWMGQLLSDWRNDGSRLKKAVRHAFRTFDVLGVHNPHDILAGLYEIKCILKLRRPVKRGTFLLHIDGPQQKTLVLSRVSRLTVGQEKTFSLARIPDDINKTPMWGTPSSEECNFIAGAGALATLELRIDGRWIWKAQKFRIYAVLMRPGSGTGGRYFVTDEREDLLAGSPRGGTQWL